MKLDIHYGRYGRYFRCSKCSEIMRSEIYDEEQILLVHRASKCEFSKVAVIPPPPPSVELDAIDHDQFVKQHKRAYWDAHPVIDSVKYLIFALFIAASIVSAMFLIFTLIFGDAKSPH